MKFLTKEVKIGLTAVVATVLVFIGINFLKGINVFEATNTYYVQFKNIGGLAVSNPVFANGYPVGIVRTINYDYSRTDRVTVGIELDDEMRVPTGTRAELESELMGGVKMTLILGEHPTQFVAQGDTIFGGMHVGSLNKLEAMIPTFESIVPKMDSIMTGINRLVNDSALIEVLHNTSAISKELATASKELNKALPQLTSNLTAISSNVNKITNDVAQVDIQNLMNQVNTTLANVQQFSAQMTSITENLSAKMGSKDNTLGLFLNDRGVYDKLNSTMSHADSLMMDLKEHPKRYVHFSIFGRKDKSDKK